MIPRKPLVQRSSPRRGFLAVAIALALQGAAPGQAAPADQNHWLQWRGPNLDGTAATDSNPPVSWSEEENIRWKIDLPGSGASTPIVIDDLVVVTTAIPTGPELQAEPGQPTREIQFCALALDRASGATRWQTVVRQEVPHEGHHRDHGYASNSVVSDGEHIYAFFGSQGLYALDLSGEVQWERDLGQMATRRGFGEGASPALHGDTLLVTWDHEAKDFIVAIDKHTGKDLWRRDRDEPTGWSTPLILEHEGTVQAVVSGTNRVRSYDLKTGEIIWEIGGMTTNTIPCPVTDGENVYLMSGFRDSVLLAVELGHRGDLTGTDAVVWSHDRQTPYVPSPLLSGNRLYFFAGNTGTLSCFKADSGRPLIEGERIAELMGGVYASPVAADGRVYLVGRSGMVVVMKDGPPFKILATNQLDDRFDASAAIVGNQLFLRGQRYLYCIAD